MWTDDIRELAQMMVDVVEGEFGVGVVTKIVVTERRVDVTLGTEESRGQLRVEGRQS